MSRGQKRGLRSEDLRAEHKDLIVVKVNGMIKGLSHELDRAFGNIMDRSRPE